MAAPSLNKPSQGTKDWHTPLNGNFTKIEDELNRGNRLYGPFFAHEQSSPNMSVRVDPGFLWDGGSLTEVSAQNTPTISAPSSSDRIDRVVQDPSDGAISVVTGTEGSGSAPAIPAGKKPICQIAVGTATTEITDDLLTDERTYELGDTLEDLRENLTVSAADLNFASQSSIVGKIIMYAAASAPSGWLLCNGQAVSRTTYSDLFSVIGTAYGNGDGSTTFNVPDLRGRFPLGYDAGNNDLGAEGGEETHTLTANEMPAHDHSGSTGDTTINEPSGYATVQPWSGGPGSPSGGAATPGSDSHSHSIPSDGGGAAHNNMPPYSIVNFLIKT